MALISGTNTPNILSGTDSGDTLTGYQSFDGSFSDSSPSTDNDTIRGHGGADLILGGHGDDALYGGVGRDMLNGGLLFDHASLPVSHETLDGGDGDDALVYTYANAIAELIGGSGNDLLSFGATGSVGIRLDISDPTTVQVLRNGSQVAGIEILRFDGGDGNDHITGGTLDDTLFGGGGNNGLSGGSGNDSLACGYGADSLFGGKGNDYVYKLGTANSLIYGGLGQDTLEFNSTFDTPALNLSIARPAVRQTLANGTKNEGFEVLKLAGSAFDDSVTGGDFGDDLYGADGDDTLRGGGGNDELYGGSGLNVVMGGAGDDLIEAGAWGEAETLDGGQGNDSVSLYRVDASFDIILDMTHPNLKQTLPDGTNLRGFEYLALNCGDGDDRIIGGDLGNALYGNAGNDVLTGGAGRDVFEGGSGNDTILGGGGRDAIYIGTFDGQGEYDVIDGGAGIDTLYVDRNAGPVDISLTDPSVWQTLSDGQTFRNIEALDMRGSAFSDQITGGIGKDVLFGDRGNDTLSGGVGNDTLDGEEGSNRLYGGDGDDLLTVSSGSDVADGGAGADKFHVELGQTTLTGGAGADEFILYGWAGLGSFGQITDFAAEDRIQLTFPPGQLGGPVPLAAEAFALGSAATGIEDRVLYDSANGTLRYDIDGLGGVAAVTFLTLVPGTLVTADNFLLA